MSLSLEGSAVKQVTLPDENSYDFRSIKYYTAWVIHNISSSSLELENYELIKPETSAGSVFGEDKLYSGQILAVKIIRHDETGLNENNLKVTVPLVAHCDGFSHIKLCDNYQNVFDILGRKSIMTIPARDCYFDAEGIRALRGQTLLLRVSPEGELILINPDVLISDSLSSWTVVEDS